MVQAGFVTFLESIWAQSPGRGLGRACVGHIDSEGSGGHSPMRCWGQESENYRYKKVDTSCLLLHKVNLIHSFYKYICSRRGPAPGVPQ